MHGLGFDVVIFRSRVAAECNERSLVLRAMNIEHVVRREPGEWLLSVPDHRVTDAVRQLALYAQENRGWPRRVIGPATLPLGLTGVRCASSSCSR